MVMGREVIQSCRRLACRVSCRGDAILTTYYYVFFIFILFIYLLFFSLFVLVSYPSPA